MFLLLLYSRVEEQYRISYLKSLCYRFYSMGRGFKDLQYALQFGVFTKENRHFEGKSTTKPYYVNNLNDKNLN